MMASVFSIVHVATVTLWTQYTVTWQQYTTVWLTKRLRSFKKCSLENTCCYTILHSSHHNWCPADHSSTASHCAAYSRNLASLPCLFWTLKIFLQGYQFSSFENALAAYKQEQCHKMIASIAGSGEWNFSLGEGTIHCRNVIVGTEISLSDYPWLKAFTYLRTLYLTSWNWVLMFRLWFWFFSFTGTVFQAGSEWPWSGYKQIERGLLIDFGFNSAPWVIMFTFFCLFYNER